MKVMVLSPYLPHARVGHGGGTAVVWTCDFTHGYIDINADYRS